MHLTLKVGVWDSSIFNSYEAFAAEALTKAPFSGPSGPVDKFQGGISAPFAYTPPDSSAAINPQAAFMANFRGFTLTEYTVAKVDQTISFAALPNIPFTPANITLGATASSGLPVSFVVGSGPATVSGNQLKLTGVGTVTVVAVQPGNAVYSPAAKTNSFVVSPATPQIAWPTPAGITFGTPLSGVQLNAQGSVPGTLVYVPPAGTVLNAGANQPLSVTFTPLDAIDYTTATAQVLLTVAKAGPTISFAAIPNQTYSTTALTLNATSTGGLPVSFSVGSGPATVNGNKLTLTGVGPVSVIASVAGNANYLAAAKTNTFTVAPAVPTLTWATPADITYGTALGAAQLNAQAGVPGTATYTPPSGTVLNAGAGQALKVNFVPTDAIRYTTTAAQVLLNVSKASQSINFAAIPNQTYSTSPVTLVATSSVGLPVTFSVNSGPATINGNKLSVTGVGIISVVASQAGNGNYLAASATNNFTVGRASQTIQFAALPNTSFTTNKIALNATASSGLNVGFSVGSGPAVVVGNQLTLTGVGTVSIIASQAGDANYLAATPTTNTFAVTKVGQTITFAGLPNTTFSTNKITLNATSSSGLPVSFQLSSGPASITGNQLTLSGVGSVSVMAIQAGDANFLAAPPVTNTFAVSPGSQTINFAALPDTTFTTNKIALNATASSGLAVSFQVASGPATVSGNFLTLTGVGTVSVVASVSGGNNFNPATATNTFTVSKANQTINFAALPNTTFSTNKITLNATASSGLTVSFQVASGPASVSGKLLTLTGAGTVSVIASVPGGSTFNPATATNTFTVNKANQTISFTSIPDTAFSTNKITLNATSSSGLPITFAVSSGPAGVSGNQLTLTGAGLVSVIATASGGSNYNPATATNSFTVTKAKQVISFATIPNTLFSTNKITLNATSSSGLPITFLVSGPAGVTGNQLTLTGLGTVTVIANAPSTSTYFAASATNSFTVSKATPTITFAALPDTTFSTNKITLNATSSSGVTVAFQIASGPATVSGKLLTLTGVGTVSVIASVPAGNNYFAASATNTFTVSKAKQVISFAALPNIPFSTNKVTLNATSSSGLPITFVVSGPAGVTGNQLTLTGLGTVTVIANAPSTSTYFAASATNSFTVSKATPAITFAALPDTTFSTNKITLNATSSSGVTVAFQVASGPATVSGKLLTLTGVGTVSVIASVPAGNNYFAASATNTFTVSKAKQVISFAALPNIPFSTNKVTLNATSSSGLPITFSVSGPAGISGNQLTLTGLGTVTVIANAPSTSSYFAASATNSFTVSKATPTIAFAALPDTTFSTNKITLNATSSSGVTVAFQVASGPATVSGKLLTLTGVGTVSVIASVPAGNNYFAASATNTFTVSKAKQVISFAALPNIPFSASKITLNATSSSGLPITFLVSGPAGVTGNQLTLTGLGTVTVIANAPSTSTYFAASATNSFTVSKATPTINFAALPNTTFSTNKITLNATSSSGVTVAFQVASGPATVSGKLLTLTGVGTVSVVASVPAGNNYFAASATNTFTVSPAASPLDSRSSELSMQAALVGESLKLYINAPLGAEVVVETTTDMNTWTEAKRVTGLGQHTPVKVNLDMEEQVPSRFWRLRMR
jgi:hypothetical protein